MNRRDFLRKSPLAAGAIVAAGAGFVAGGGLTAPISRSTLETLNRALWEEFGNNYSGQYMNYHLGFTGFKPSYQNNMIAGQWTAWQPDYHRGYYVNVRGPGEGLYTSGYYFDVSGSPNREDLLTVDGIRQLWADVRMARARLLVLIGEGSLL